MRTHRNRLRRGFTAGTGLLATFLGLAAGKPLAAHEGHQHSAMGTVLAVSAGIQQVDIELVALTPLPTSPTLARSNTTGSNASLGGRGNCFKWSAPVGINAKYVVKATRGQGIAAAQLYSK